MLARQNYEDLRERIERIYTTFWRASQQAYMLMSAFMLRAKLLVNGLTEFSRFWRVMIHRVSVGA